MNDDLKKARTTLAVLKYSCKAIDAVILIGYILLLLLYFLNIKSIYETFIQKIPNLYIVIFSFAILFFSPLLIKLLRKLNQLIFNKGIKHYSAIIIQNELLPEIKKYVDVKSFEPDQYFIGNNIICDYPSGSNYLIGTYKMNNRFEFSNLQFENKGRSSILKRPTVFSGLCLVYYPDRESDESAILEIKKTLTFYFPQAYVDRYNLSGLILRIPRKKLFENISSPYAIKEDIHFLIELFKVIDSCIDHTERTPEWNMDKQNL